MRSVDRQVHRIDAAGYGKAGRGPVADVQLQGMDKAPHTRAEEFFDASRQVVIFFLASFVVRAGSVLCRLSAGTAGCERGL